MDEIDIDVILYWDSSDLKMAMVNGALQKQDWNSETFWKTKFANIDFYLKEINNNDVVVIIILPERPGKKLLSTCE